jgi:hypothetical protein
VGRTPLVSVTWCSWSNFQRGKVGLLELEEEVQRKRKTQW